jgi:hypothetical protein
LSKNSVNRDKAFQHKEATISASDPIIARAAAFLDRKLPKFFYETDIDIDRSAIESRADDYVAEIVFESPNKVLDLGACDVIDWSKGGTGTITPVTPPSTSTVNPFKVRVNSSDSTKGTLDSQIAGHIGWTKAVGVAFKAGDEIASMTTPKGDVVSIIAPTDGIITAVHSPDGKFVRINEFLCDI